jgi:hypothetical protein
MVILKSYSFFSVNQLINYFSKFLFIFLNFGKKIFFKVFQTNIKKIIFYLSGFGEVYTIVSSLESIPETR